MDYFILFFIAIFLWYNQEEKMKYIYFYRNI